MKAEAWIFASCTVFLVIVTPSYWFITDGGDTGADWTGTSALTMTTLLTGMVTLYLGFHAKKMDPRPEDRKDAEIVEGAGELGLLPAVLLVAAVVRLGAGRDGLRRRRVRLVAVHHRCGARCAGAERPRLRVLPGRARPLGRLL